MTDSSARQGCCIIGGGPGGLMLGLLLARNGIPVTLLEAQKDFERDFRGDTLNPAVMELMAQLGLVEGLFQIPHQRIERLFLRTPTGTHLAADFSLLKGRYPFLFNVRQSRFLDFLAREASRYPAFDLRMNSPVCGLIEDEGRVVGVRYRGLHGEKEVRTPLTIAADGRFSHTRQFAGFSPVKRFPDVYDVLWFRLPRATGDEALLNLETYFGNGYYFCIADRGDHWQIPYQIPKGDFQKVRARGLEALKQSIEDLEPRLSQSLKALSDWAQIRLLPVELCHLKRWYKPGLLFIGDAAHTMSPAGGFGVNTALQDAVVAANLLTGPLKDGALRTSHLAAVQRKRKWVVLLSQALQAAAHKQLIKKALSPEKPFKTPFYLKLRFGQRLSTRLTAYGVWRVRVKRALELPVIAGL